MDEEKFFNKKVGEFLEQLEIAGCDGNQKFAAKKKLWAIFDEIKVRFELKVRVSYDNRERDRFRN